jgi:hypothetical protein
MTEIELLSWARGPGLQIATIVFVAGVVIRILEILKFSCLAEKPTWRRRKVPRCPMASGR